MDLINQIKIKGRVNSCQKVIQEAYVKFKPDKLALAWTGGKDSTLILWLTRQYCLKSGNILPKILFIDEGDLFPEIIAFSGKLSKDWNFTYEMVRNDDVIKIGKKLRNTIEIKKLNSRNRLEVERLGYDKPTFIFEAESFVGNHLMKTVPLNQYIEKNNIDAVITGIRRDENPARSKEVYFSIRENPHHFRVHPILELTEHDVWQIIHQNKIPYVSLYEKGYRSLGAKSTTHKAGKLPAWQQVTDGKTPERAGRRQDKEKIMEKLRKLGYM